jgi:hypothetical protein
VENDIETLAITLYVKIDDMLKKCRISRRPARKAVSLLL